jgi:Domain of unknown function (DUF4249)
MKKSSFVFLCLLLLSSCIDLINIEVPDSYSSQRVVDGVITDEPGPYTIQLSRSTSTEKFFLKFAKGVEGAKVTLADDIGTSEILTENEPGTYQTKADGIQGVVGRSYSIKIETKDGKVYQSIPDTMKPVGDLDSLYYEPESYLPLNDQTRYGFRFYIDGSGVPDIDNLVRWKFTGVFQIYAEPKLHTSPPNCRKDPRLCSGWIFGDFGLQKVSDNCSCCTCWVTRYEDKPRVSDNQFVANSRVKKIEVGYVPLEYFSFQEGKYRVEVKQMSLSKEAFDYLRLIQAQKEGATSLFQPPTGKIRSNIFEQNGADQVLGVFYASAVKKKQLYLGYKDIQAKFSRVPLWDCEKGIIAESCILAFPNSSNKPPADWK